MMASDEYCPAAVGNLRKANKSWVHLSIILGRKGANPRVSGMFFITLMQSVHVFGAETWVMNPRVRRALGAFQDRVSQWITGRQPRRLLDRVWEYTPPETAIHEA